MDVFDLAALDRSVLEDDTPLLWTDEVDDDAGVDDARVDADDDIHSPVSAFDSVRNINPQSFQWFHAIPFCM